ncbi:hypothetical protein ACP275_04G181200 [Erythranthe tilingii]
MELLHPFIFPFLVSLFLLWSITKWLFIKKSAANKKNSPPSPRKLPILGNLHQVGSLPHRDFQTLARKHGPFMLLHFGAVPVIIVSSADSAREIMTTHDIIFSNRPDFKSFKKLLYGCRDVAVAPYGAYWKQMKGIFVHQLLSNKRVQSFRYIREEETDHLIGKIIRESCNAGNKVVNLSRMFSELAIDGICRSAFGVKCSGSENGEKFLVLLKDVMELLGAICIGDFVPWLGWIDRVNGLDKRMDDVARGLDCFLEDVIRKHTEASKERNGENFLDILLEICGDNNTLEKDSIKALLLDVFAGGTDTIATLLEWLMSELFRHPIVMEKLQNEVIEILRGKHAIKDDDLEKMHYLKAVVKETLRCHPPIPLLTRRIMDKDVKVMGYDVSKGTMVMINGWAIGRDPQYWDEPEKFEPERFLKKKYSNNNNIAFKGLDFEFMSFGAGRRGCPGISFAVATIEFVVANIVHKFNWELPDGLQGKDLDMSESPGATVRRATPLLAIATLN